MPAIVWSRSKSAKVPMLQSRGACTRVAHIALTNHITMRCRRRGFRGRGYQLTVTLSRLSPSDESTAIVLSQRVVFPLQKYPDIVLGK